MDCILLEALRHAGSAQSGSKVVASGGAEILTTRSGSRLRAEMPRSPC